ncbi:ATP-binding protein [Cupriavidus agavae]|uniref:Putative ATPase n=1 Tax=Cupriavidus agavae TaxID=1001822 RepID=A0A4Q7R7Q2_9BURK|nr:serine/threonine-protein kinase PknK [Cupriavidus agavae]RZT28851.1 putative ATPase [Cupriavidus agavae]
MSPSENAMVHCHQTRWKNGEFSLSRESISIQRDRSPTAMLVARPAAADYAAMALDSFTREFALRHALDDSWAIRPLKLVCEGSDPCLFLRDPGGVPLGSLLGKPMPVETTLRYGLSIATALEGLHAAQLVHRNIKPNNLIVDCDDGRVRLTGFGLASNLPRERRIPEPPEAIAGTLSYMSPEQTGRMNRSVDSRSDLYALGVTLYEMLTGALPFAAESPLEWVHCHVARKPLPPASTLSLPSTLSRVVMKLLSKTAEDRYQTARGLRQDLQRCLDEWASSKEIVDFALDQYGSEDRLVIPEKLYGRETEVQTLLAAFERCTQKRSLEFALVSGYSGIGKSSVVNELHRALVPSRGLFAFGKFDQYNRGVPYATLVQAFRGLVRGLLAKAPAERLTWRSAFQEALAPNARLITDLVPELVSIIGQPEPVAPQEPKVALRRFSLTFQRFIGVFAHASHPLVLFLDDLQWLDAATLDFLEDLLVAGEVQHLLVIGAYRDNEVDSSHPLAMKLAAIRNAGVNLQEIRLTPLEPAHIEKLLADALHAEPAKVAPLARVVTDKSGGNPFFTVQFLNALVSDRLVTFSSETRQWSWDISRIGRKGYTDNVVDLMVRRIESLPPDFRESLQQLSCLGEETDLPTLCAVLGLDEQGVHTALRAAVCDGLIERRGDRYVFAHDRVQEAAYSLISPSEREQIHLGIGRVLLNTTSVEKREELIFEIVGQLNRGASLISDERERLELARLNLIAGRRAKSATAYASALNYLAAGQSLLEETHWSGSRDLRFGLELTRAECEFLTGSLTTAESRLTALAHRASDIPETAAVACMQMDVYLVLDRNDLAVSVCLDYLRKVDIEWSPHPDDAMVCYEYERIWSLVGDRSIESLIDLPLMQDPVALSTVEALSKLFAPAVQSDANLACLTVCRAVSLSLQFGNCDASCVLYANVGRVAGRRFGDYAAGLRFGELGCNLVDRRGLGRYEAKTFLCFAIFVLRWMRPVRLCRDFLRRAFLAANRIGDLPYGAYVGNNLIADLLFSGEELTAVEEEAERGLAYAKRIGFGLVKDFITVQMAMIRTLRGRTSPFGHLDDGANSEVEIERHMSSSPELALAACLYWVRKLQARYFSGDFEAALDAAMNAERLLWIASSFSEEAEYHFYAALTRAALCEVVSIRSKDHQQALTAHHAQLSHWATECCAENFSSRATLVDAEIARIERRYEDAEQRYEAAIQAAATSGFVQIEALAFELASRFHRSRGRERVSRLYMDHAIERYGCWGAQGKVRQLSDGAGDSTSSGPAKSETYTTTTSVDQLDLNTVVRVLQAAWMKSISRN